MFSLSHWTIVSSCRHWLILFIFPRVQHCGVSPVLMAQLCRLQCWLCFVSCTCVILCVTLQRLYEEEKLFVHWNSLLPFGSSFSLVFVLFRENVFVLFRETILWMSVSGAWMVFAWLQSAMVGCIAVKVISLFSVQPCPLIPSSLKIKCL